MAKRTVNAAEEQAWQQAMDVANGFYKKGRLEAAEERFKEALTLAEGFGANDPRLATTLNNLGLLYYNQQRHDEAEPLYRRAMQIREKALGHDHPLVAATMNNLALLYHAQDKLSKAEHIAREALEIRQKALGHNHLDSAVSLCNLALIVHSRKNSAEAERLFEQALEIRRNELGPKHPLVADTLKNLANICDALEDKGKAHALRQEIRQLEKKDKPQRGGKTAKSTKSQSEPVETADSTPLLEVPPVAPEPTAVPGVAAPSSVLAETHLDAEENYRMGCRSAKRMRGFVQTRMGHTRPRGNHCHTTRRHWGWVLPLSQ